MNFKNLIFVLLFLLFISNGKTYSQECESYRVVNIDSTENYYFILVKKNEKKYLIASSKKRIKPHRRVLLNKNYYFKLVNHKWIEEFPINVLNFPASLVIEGKTIWRTEDDYSVYRTKNIKGINYVKRCGCPK